MLNFDLVILGHIAKDIIVINGKKREAIGGAVYYGGIAASHMGLKVAVITRLRKSDVDILDDFKKYGVKFFVHYTDETSGIRNTYTSKDMEYRVCAPLGFAGLFDINEIPEIDTKYFILAPILGGEIDIKLLGELNKRYPDKLCIDIQGFIRFQNKDTDSIYFCELSEHDKKEILSKVTILKVDRAEMKALTGMDDVSEGGKELSKYGPREILISHQKGLSLYTDGEVYFYPWRNKWMRGRTGRGDTSFVSYVGSRIKKSPKESLKFATALTSLKLESAGPFIRPLNQVNNLIEKEYK
ncbi:MAG: PfkB family carbohydrate kinase [Promethearchaeia archaeon]